MLSKEKFLQSWNRNTHPNSDVELRQEFELNSRVFRKADREFFGTITHIDAESVLVKWSDGKFEAFTTEVAQADLGLLKSKFTIVKCGDRYLVKCGEVVCIELQDHWQATHHMEKLKKLNPRIY